MSEQTNPIAEQEEAIAVEGQAEEIEAPAVEAVEEQAEEIQALAAETAGVTTAEPETAATPTQSTPVQRPSSVVDAAANDDDDDDVGGDDSDYEDEEDDYSGPMEYAQREKGGRSRVGTDVRFEDINFKNIAVLSRFLDRRGRIMSRRKTRVSAKVQRRIQREVKRARHLALLPYTADQTRIVTKRR